MSNDFLDQLVGRVPPQSIQEEEYILGAMMIESEVVDTVFSILKTPEAFYKEAHQKLAEVIYNMREKGIQIDIGTVTKECHKAGVLEEVGGPIYITQLTGPIASAAHVEQYCTYVADAYAKRKLIQLATSASEKAFESGSDPDDILNQIDHGIREIESMQVSDTGVHISVAVTESENLVSEMNSGIHTIIRKSGLSSFDSRFGGFMPGRVVIIAARPSMGKTSLGLSMARNQAEEHPVGIFSLEMSKLELVNNLIAAEGDFNNTVFMKKMEDPTVVAKYNKAKDVISSLPIYIDDTASLNYIELRRKARKMVKELGVKVIYIDYLQLMSGIHKRNYNRENEVGEISRNLKIIAKELNVPIVAMAQLNRSVEQRAGTNRPRLSDLRESGTLEQDADMVIFIYRPEQYDIKYDDEGNSTKGVAYIMVAKNRTGGPCGDVQVSFIDYCTKFVDTENAVYSIDDNERFDINEQFNLDFNE